MASKLAAAALTQATGPKSKARNFYLEICRCLPFIQRLHKLDEVVSVRELRAIVKDKFHEFKDVKDPRVSDLLIFKGREELECYLMMHKQRHHAVTEYIEPFEVKQLKVPATPTVPGGSSFLNTFFETPYPQVTRKL